ncbi:hypothetical protein [Roseibium sediminicola]|uniref:Uncharacterized protein n=1 Tax=Roseibium sediminicola TaxID=2933272 RepID=A0ABT0GUN2_9HYPH|nr:hypothetical protein [Roseibium sp. CAU 1639]MCK7612807.1 hypothetical protein [Roseibium sp. CAU 1639]
MCKLHCPARYLARSAPVFRAPEGSLPARPTCFEGKLNAVSIKKSLEFYQNAFLNGTYRLQIAKTKRLPLDFSAKITLPPVEKNIVKNDGAATQIGSAPACGALG